MRKIILFLLLITLTFMITGCSQKYTEEQIDALSRIDPLHLLTENKDFFKQYTKDTLLTAKDTYDFGEQAMFLEDGRIQTEYFGCSEPFTVSWSFLGSGEIFGFGYYFSDRIGNSYNAINNYAEWLSQTRQDFITVFGPNYSESYGETSACKTFEDVVENLNNKKTTHYFLTVGAVQMMFIAGAAYENSIEIVIIFDLRNIL